MSYRFESHCHTAEVSGCSTTPAADMMHALKQAGYAGAAITNHYMIEYIGPDPRSVHSLKALDRWIAGNLYALEQGEKSGLRTVWGMEIRFHRQGVNDYLVYGITESFLRQNLGLYHLLPEEFAEVAKENGLFFAQAHPYRQGCTQEGGAYLDGLEVFNGTQDSAANARAYQYAQQHHLRMTVGSDFHHPHQVGTTALLLPALPEDSQDFARMLHQGAIDGYYVKELFSHEQNAPFQQDSRFCADIL